MHGSMSLVRVVDAHSFGVLCRGLGVYACACLGSVCRRCFLRCRVSRRYDWFNLIETMVAPNNTIMVKKIVGNHDSGKYGQAAIPVPRVFEGPESGLPLTARVNAWSTCHASC